MMNFGMCWGYECVLVRGSNSNIQNCSGKLAGKLGKFGAAAAAARFTIAAAMQLGQN